MCIKCKLMRALVPLFLWLLCAAVVPAHAQNETRWCETTEPETAPRPEPLRVEDFPQIAALVPLLPNHEYSLWYGVGLKISADGTRAVTGQRNLETLHQELFVIDLVNNRIYFHLSFEQVQSLRPPTEGPNYEGVFLRRVEWLGTSNRLALQTQYLCRVCGEYTPPADDLYVVDEEGNFLTLLQNDAPADLEASPDGMYALFGGSARISLLSIDGTTRIDDVVPDYRAEIPIESSEWIFARWENNESALVFSHRNPVDDEDPLVKIWRVYADGRETEFVREFKAFLVNMRFHPSYRYIAYFRPND